MRYHFVTFIIYYYLSHERKYQLKGEKMKISKMLQKAVKKEGKHSLTCKTIVKLKNSKEFSYLVDQNR